MPQGVDKILDLGAVPQGFDTNLDLGCAEYKSLQQLALPFFNFKKAKSTGRKPHAWFQRCMFLYV